MTSPADHYGSDYDDGPNPDDYDASDRYGGDYDNEPDYYDEYD